MTKANISLQVLSSANDSQIKELLAKRLFPEQQYPKVGFPNLHIP